MSVTRAAFVAVACVAAVVGFSYVAEAGNGNWSPWVSIPNPPLPADVPDYCVRAEYPKECNFSNGKCVAGEWTCYQDCKDNAGNPTDTPGLATRIRCVNIGGSGW